jgi:hypothetical protein
VDYIFHLRIYTTGRIHQFVVREGIHMMADGRQFDKPTRYQIKVRGGLDERWSDWFDDLTVVQNHDETLLTGMLRDQAALHGLLARIRDLGLPLLLVEQIRDA